MRPAPMKEMNRMAEEMRDYLRDLLVKHRSVVAAAEAAVAIAAPDKRATLGPLLDAAAKLASGPVAEAERLLLDNRPRLSEIVFANFPLTRATEAYLAVVKTAASL